MRTIIRDKSLVYYSNATEGVDEWGNTVNNVYETPIPIRLSVSVEQGVLLQRQYGKQVNYDRVIITELTELPIQESTRFWIDESINNPHNYIVKKIARSKNFINIGLDRVDLTKAVL